MNEREREQIREILSIQGSKDALRRNTNRLFLAENPYLQKLILEDPLEIGHFIAESMKKRIGSVSLGDMYMLIASPDSTFYLVQVTPDFPSHDIVRGEELLNRLNEIIPDKISSSIKTIPDIGPQFTGVKWHLTGKMVFQQESGADFRPRKLNNCTVFFRPCAGSSFRCLPELLVRGPLVDLTGGRYWAKLRDNVFELR